MGLDITITVRHATTLPEINEKLAELGAPFVVGVLRLKADSDGSQPDWSKPFQYGACHAYPLKPELSFQLLGRSSVSFDGSEYNIETETYDVEADISCALALALVIARSGKGKIVNPATGGYYKLRVYEEETRERLAMISKNLEERAALVPAEVAAYRRPRPEDTVWTHYERVALHEHPDSSVANYLRERASAALHRGDNGEFERLLAAAPMRPALIEPLLDPCFRADLPDLGRRVLGRFGALAREHLLAVAEFTGGLALPYARFLVGLGVVELNAELRDRALHAARDEEMRSFIERWPNVNT